MSAQGRSTEDTESTESLPVGDPSSSSSSVQSEVSGRTSTRVLRDKEDDLLSLGSVAPSDFNPSWTTVPSGLDKPSTSKAGSSTDSDAEGATGSGEVPLPKDLVPSGIRKDEIKISLLNEELWKFLRQHGNEMMIRPRGCLLSPPLKFKMSGLDKIKLYNISLEFPLRDNYLWVFVKTTWTKARRTKEQKKVPKVKHPRSPQSGEYWMTTGDGISFYNVRLCSDPVTDDANKVKVKVLHAYLPTISVIEVDESNEPIKESLVTVPIPETAFIAVRSYHNPQIRRVKRSSSPK